MEFWNFILVILGSEIFLRKELMQIKLSHKLLLADIILK